MTTPVLGLLVNVGAAWLIVRYWRLPAWWMVPIVAVLAVIWRVAATGAP